MPSKRRQFNVRADDETEERIERLLPLVKQSLGLEVSVSDLFRLGMLELEKRFGNTADVPAELSHKLGGKKKK